MKVRLCFDDEVFHQAIRILIGAGSTLVFIGLAGAVVFQLQPWRSCPDDTSPAACPMLPGDYSAFQAFVLVLLAGVLALLAAAARLKKAPLQQ